jgi:type I restriction enzyme, S subunit
VKSKLIPEVRFPEFTEDWGQRKLGEISEKVTEKNKNNIYSETLTNSAEFGIINQRDFFDKDISNEKNLNGYYVVRPDDFVYNPRISNLAPVGPIKRNKLGRTGVMSPLYYVFRTHEVDKTFLEKYFSSNSWHIFMKLNGDSGARSDRFAIKDSIFREMPIPFPSIKEQNKISNFFEELDDTIALHQQELATLKQIKLGFLQKMFPKEGETIPEIRFQGFSGDWELKKLGDVLESLYNGQTPSRNKKEFWNGDINWLTSGELNRSTVNSATEKITELGQKDANLKVVPKNTFVISITGLEAAGTRGNCGILGIDTTLNQSCMALIPKKNLLDTNFLFQWYRMVGENYGLRFTQGTKQQSYNAEIIKKLDICLPKIEEQIKIGKFLKKIDESIELQKKEIEALKETKKAFLQKMFV